MSARSATILGVAGVIGWLGLIWLTVQLYSTTPPTAGFDLELLLQAGRNVAAGRSAYDPALISGSAPVAENLFYSYPPLVAQAMALVTAAPSPLMLLVWDAAAVAGLALVAIRLAQRLAPDLLAREVAFASLALAPLLFPFAIGLVFGNLDVFFPLLYGLLLVGVLDSAPARDSIAGGIALAIASLTKLHPGSLGLWALVRAVRGREARRVLVASIVAGLTMLAVSLVVGGIAPWGDYAGVVRTGSGAEIVDPRNAGPAAQIALLIGSTGVLDPERLARTSQIVVTGVALAVSAIAAWRLRDPVESLAWAAAASLVILPVTWYHYPSALIPFGIAAVLRARDTEGARATTTCVFAAAITGALAIAWLPLLYVSVGLVLLAARMSRAEVRGSSVVTGLVAA